MKHLKRSHHLNEHLPNQLLVHQSPVLLVSDNLLIEVAIICEFHHQTKRLGTVFKECFLVTHNVRMPIDQVILLIYHLRKRSQYSDFIQGILHLLVRECSHFHLHLLSIAHSFICLMHFNYLSIYLFQSIFLTI
jgi:hypothetical protein